MAVLAYTQLSDGLLSSEGRDRCAGDESRREARLNQT
ncbi:MAG: hypothetical protein QOH16_677 [Gaiellaceae bacterium]|nr:hypothetical protein [Gaiellaceae bacterium]